MKNNMYGKSQSDWDALRKPFYNKIVLNMNGDARIYTPSGVFVVSPDSDPDYHGLWVSFQPYNVEDYEQQLVYLQDTQEEAIKLVTWEDPKTDNDSQLIYINKVKEEDLCL